MSRNEAETRAELIDPAIAEVGWGKVDGSRVRQDGFMLGDMIEVGFPFLGKTALLVVPKMGMLSSFPSIGRFK